MCCPCYALVEDDAEELHRLLDLDRDVIDIQVDICRAVLASSEENGDRLVDRDLEASFFEEFCRPVRYRCTTLDNAETFGPDFRIELSSANSASLTPFVDSGRSLIMMMNSSGISTLP